MICLLSWVAGMVIRTIIVCVWIFYFHPGVPHVMWFASWSVGVWVWPMWISSWGFVGWAWTWVTLVSGVVWWGASVCRWSVVGPMWCVMVELMAITPVCGTWTLWATPGVMWLRLCHDMEQPLYESWTCAVVTVKCDCDLECLCLSLFSWQYLELDLAWWHLCGFGLMVLCWSSQRRYPVWTIHYNVSILITFKTPNVGANFLLYVLVPGTGNSDPHHLTSCCL